MQVLTLNSLTMWWLWNTRKQKVSSLSIEDEFYLQEQILESIFQYFNEKKQQILIGQREGKLIFLILKNDKKFSINAVMKDFHDHVLQKFPRGEFKLGISNKATIFNTPPLIMRKQ